MKDRIKCSEMSRGCRSESWVGCRYVQVSPGQHFVSVAWLCWVPLLVGWCVTIYVARQRAKRCAGFAVVYGLKSVASVLCSVCYV
jgi:hypothetical protein